MQEEWEEQEDQEEWDEQEETTKGKRAPADQGKKLRTGRLIFRKEGTKGFIERLALRSDVDNSKDRRKAISPESNRASTALAHGEENEN